MWKVFGVQTNLIAAADVWQEQLIKLSARKKDRERFVRLLGEADISYSFDTIRELHIFTVKYPADAQDEDIEFMEKFIAKVTKSTELPTISYKDEPQKFVVVLSLDQETNEYLERQKTRDERTKALNEMLEKEERAYRP